MKKKLQSDPTEAEKVIHTWGKWVERPRKTVTLTCECGNKYIKTRPRQTTCIPCMMRAKAR